MPEQDFDLAVGIDSASLEAGVGELHRRHRDTLFKGHDVQIIKGTEVTLDWIVKSAPTVVLGPPSQQDWGKATDVNGKKPPSGPLPEGNVLRITLCSTDVTLTYGQAKSVSVTNKDIDVYARLSVAGGRIAVTILAVRLDTAGMAVWDVFVVEKIVLPNLIKAGSNALSQLAIPTQELFEAKLEVVPNRVLVTGSHLILAANANIGGSTAPDHLAADFTWPDKPLWVLFSRRLLTWVLDVTLQSAVNRTQNCKKDFGVITVSVDFKLRSYQDLAIDPEKLTSASAKLDMCYDARVSVLSIDPDKCALVDATREM
ncbi:hypothetical protein [Kitasatospora griseola]|uniref:hypothetical protein n=1 Tax=Kitasatospora griseola TaxID=2064 RepID=UPI0037F521D2